MLPSKIYLIDRSANFVNQWKTSFADIPHVTASTCDYFQRRADSIGSVRIEVDSAIKCYLPLRHHAI